MPCLVIAKSPSTSDWHDPEDACRNETPWDQPQSPAPPYFFEFIQALHQHGTLTSVVGGAWRVSILAGEAPGT